MVQVRLTKQQSKAELLKDESDKQPQKGVLHLVFLRGIHVKLFSSAHRY